MKFFKAGETNAHFFHILLGVDLILYKFSGKNKYKFITIYKYEKIFA